MLFNTNPLFLHEFLNQINRNMKKVIFALTIVLASTGAFAQKDNGAKSNVIKANPLGFIFGQASVSFEHAINEKSSFVISPLFGGFKFGGFKYSNFGAGAEYRIYFSNTKTAPEGFYAAPGVSFTSGKIKEDGSSTEAKFTAFGAKAVIGNQWIFNSGFVIDLNGGISYNSFKYKDNTDPTFSSLKGSGVFPSLSFAIGYNF